MVTKYIIMCGGDYVKWQKPRQLSIINGEEIVARTIRLLKENGITDISISSNNPIFEKFNVPVLKHDNLYIANGIGNVKGDWFNAFYPIDEPVCYIFGDVVFSPQAIKKIIETDTDDIELFGSGPPFASNYCKTHEEPFALKVVNQKHLHEAIEKTRELDKEHKFWRKPIVWELFTVIKNAPLQVKMGEYTTDYVVINDYTCDVDFEEDIEKLNRIIGGKKMIKVEVIEEFTYRDFYKIKSSLVRKKREKEGLLFVGDTFECDEEILKYLTGDNALNKTVVKVIEYKPDEKVDLIAEVEKNKEKIDKIIIEPDKPKKAKKRRK